MEESGRVDPCGSNTWKRGSRKVGAIENNNQRATPDLHHTQSSHLWRMFVWMPFQCRFSIRTFDFLDPRR